ncbi:MAG: tetratricopeptide repeat protein [Bacteroidetes bacterium]|nr:tetratricopeptide repeat protein [Bacteroidota bacterium]
MKQRLLLTFISLLILLPSYLLGSDLDSLKQEISVLSQDRTKRKELMLSYRAICKYYFDHNQRSEATQYLNDGLIIARELKDREQEYFFLERLGILNFYPLDNYAKAITLLLDAERIGNAVAKPDQMAHTLSRIAQVYVSLGHYDDAIEYQYRALNIADKLKDTTRLADSYYIMGTIYWSQDAYKKALENFKNALKMGRYVKNDRDLYTYMAAVGAMYVELKEYDEAMDYLRRSQELAIKIGHLYGDAYSEGAIGSVYKEQGSYSRALESLDRSVLIFDSLGIRHEYAGFQLEVADVYTRMDNPDRALKLLEKIEPTIDGIRSLSLKKDLYKHRFEAYEKLNQLDKALKTYKEYIGIKDSLLNEKKIAKVVQAEHEVELAKIQAEETRKSIEDANEQKYLMASGILVFFLMLGAGVYWARLRNRELRESNQLLEAKTREIKLQMERLASSNEELRQFAHVTSHDLREPLRSISSFTTLLKRRYAGKLDPEADEFIKFITNGVKRMDTLLSDLLAYSVVGIGRTEYEMVDINEIIAGIIASLNRDKATQGARISIQNLPELVANKKQISQLFQHLIDNAIKFRREEVPEIKISCQSHEEGHLFSIRDNGIGMDEAYKDKIFGLFLRLHHKKTKYKGTGIGLSICKKIVEQHKGRIWIESKLGEGTTVFFVLPDSPLESEDPFEEPETISSHHHLTVE